MLMFVVLITEGQRNIPITYATRATGGKGEKAGSSYSGESGWYDSYHLCHFNDDFPVCDGSIL